MFVDDYRFGPSWWWRKWIWGIRADIWIKNGGISEKLIKAGQATRIDPQSLPPVLDISGGITQMAQAEKPKAPAHPQDPVSGRYPVRPPALQGRRVPGEPRGLEGVHAGCHGRHGAETQGCKVSQFRPGHGDIEFHRCSRLVSKKSKGAGNPAPFYLLPLLMAIRPLHCAGIAIP